MACLLKKDADAFVEALKDGRITPEKMLAMTSAERREFFSGIVGSENAKMVNAQLEAKLLLKDQNRGMTTWAKNIAGLSPKEKASFVDKVSKLDRTLDPQEREGFLSDLAEKKLGVGVSSDEMKTILDLSKKAASLKNVNPKMSGVSDDYLNASQELRNYIESLKPVSAWKSITGNLLTLFRNNLLLNPSTPIKATISQVSNTAMDYLTRRMGALSAKSLNPELASKANSEAWDTFKKTGLNTAAMENIDDHGMLGEKNRFAPQTGKDSAGPVVKAVDAATRKAAQISTKVAIDWEHNISYVKFYQKSFFDAANVISSQLAKGDKAKASTMLSDASRIQPKTDEGKIVRGMAQEQAARVLSSNNSPLSRLSLGIKDAFNKAVPRLGDALVPIAKIPANVIWNGIENSGVGIPLGARDIVLGRKKIQSDDLKTKYEGMAQMAAGIQRVGRTMGVMTAAILFASYLSKKDFKQDKYGNHFVKIGDVWINTEYIGAISPALAGAMSVKEKGGFLHQNPVNSAAQYVGGAARGLEGTPGIDEGSKLIHEAFESDPAKGIKKYFGDFFTSRSTPEFFQNLIKNRPIDRLFFGAHGVETDKDVSQDKRDLKAKSKESRHHVN